MKFFRSLLVIVLALSLTPLMHASAEQKSLDLYYPEDLDFDYWAFDELDDFINAGIIDGHIENEIDEDSGEEYSVVYIQPEATITRAEFTKILVNALGLKLEGSGKSFPDVKASSWYYDYVQTASSLGIVNGKLDGSFAPGEKIKRDQVAAMIYRAFKSSIEFKDSGLAFKDVVPSTNFAYEAINKTSANGIVKGYGELFKPHNFATRAQAIVMIHRALLQQTSDLPDDAALTTAVQRLNKDEIEYINNGDKAQLQNLYTDTTTDYQYAASMEGLDALDYIKEENGSIKVDVTKDFNLTVLSKNNRFAKVHVNDFQYTVTTTFPDGHTSININASNTAYLKKTDDGSWKVYYVELDDDQEESAANEAMALTDK
ncbi:S-layer homology domain-containing protein [Falsibacillus albus]|uniref:S-layer homology domain-containing protein n=1 Tax=Falsibacillus albus TaxID=2478915 RepID=A0A3L7K360_9BACI|nr:S-layer homology domain-containing protein [Falsibacillus albus]RLQ96744.1 S-layer homology domain-containing protein [Falsibacillus albus]